MKSFRASFLTTMQENLISIIGEKLLKTIKNFNIWKLNNTLLNNQQITEEIKKEIKICIETNENENITPKTYGIL